MVHATFELVARPRRLLLDRPVQLLVGWLKFGWYVPAGVSIEADAYIHGARYMKIGEGFHAGPHMWLEAVDRYGNDVTLQHFSPKLIIGRSVSFSWFGHIGCTHYIEIGDHVLFGSRCYVTDHSHGVYKGTRQDGPDSIPCDRPLTEDGEVIIGDNVWVGDNTVILPGVHIGRGAIIGANSVVTHDIPSATIAVGVPARPIKMWDEELGKWVKY